MIPLRLKEDPREWRKFGLGLAGALLLLLLLLVWRGGWTSVPLGLGGVVFLLVVAAAAFPSALRPVYRVGMRLGHALGRLVGGVLLAVCFVVVVIPVGAVVRMTGRDLLRLHRDPATGSYWEKARPPSRLDRMF